MDTKLIECKTIDVPKADGSRRTFSKEFAVKLADSLKIDGQLNPIVVRVNPNSPSRYILVAGRHRLYGLRNVLKEQFIRATIADLKEEEADIAADVENLWRNPLNKAQTASALKRWHAHWLEQLPAPAQEPTRTDPAVAASKDHNDRAALRAPAKSTATQEGEFNKKVATVTGQSEASVKRTKTLAASFTEDQLEVFTQMETSQVDMLTISRIKDVAKRGEVVALVATGMDPTEAVKEVMKNEAPKRYDTYEKEDGAAKAAKPEAKAVKEPALTDDEWFAANCDEKAAMLGDPTKFKADALLFRAVSDLRHAFRAKGKKFLVETKKVGVTGAFYNLVNRFVSISHPKDWLICPECKGKGGIESIAQGDHITKTRCGKCFGGGYLLKTEEYL